MSDTKTYLTSGPQLLRDANSAKNADLNYLLDVGATRVFAANHEIWTPGIGKLYAEVPMQRVALIEVRRRYMERLNQGSYTFTSGLPILGEGLPKDSEPEHTILLTGLLRIASNQINRDIFMAESQLDLICGLATQKVHYVDEDGWVRTPFGKMCSQNEVQRRALVTLAEMYSKGLREYSIVMSSETGMPIAVNPHSYESKVIASLQLSYERNKQWYVKGHPKILQLTDTITDELNKV